MKNEKSDKTPATSATSATQDAGLTGLLGGSIDPKDPPCVGGSRGGGNSARERLGPEGFGG